MPKRKQKPSHSGERLHEDLIKHLRPSPWFIFTLIVRLLVVLTTISWASLGTFNLMQELGMDFLSGVLASLIAAACVGAAGYFWGGAKYRKKIWSAPSSYADHIEKLIVEASSESIEKVNINARAIVSTRDDLRGSLTSLAKLLNSEIDRLSEQLENNANSEALAETIAVLNKKWPSKRTQIEVEIRKIITELGFEKT